MGQNELQAGLSQRGNVNVGGKTGSAEKVINGRYAEGRLLTSFMGVVPISQPKYLFLTMLDEPQALPETSGYATSGWNAVPTTRTIMMRTLALLGVQSNRLPGEAATKTAN
ncbi:MAG TPA: penicillin-binding transpeptidase domain-containing protein [Kaistia sp.]|nr:penicillin-binding transpeptidase domain-containing protein [Kaistia sp.]